MVTPVYKDRVREATNTTGTSDLTLGGAITGYQDFTVLATGDQCYYCIESGNGSDWEVGKGTYTATPPGTLSRDTVLDSSNSGSKINLFGTSQVFITYPGQKAIDVDGALGFSIVMGS